MDNYREIVKSVGGSRKHLGQSFLVNRDIAAFESEYAKNLNVIELGPGLGMLTELLCKTAKKVIAIEKDKRLFEFLNNNIESKKLTLINDDFFSVDTEKFGIDIMVSNIPYNLSSKVIYWLGSKKIPALICVQKEFAQHMLAKPNTRDYSKLSVVSSLNFNLHRIKEISANNFYPVPKVDSCIVYLAPKPSALDDSVVVIISLIMNHKKKRLRNSIIDSAKALGITKEEAREISMQLKHSDERPFQLEPKDILETAESIIALIRKSR